MMIDTDVRINRDTITTDDRGSFFENDSQLKQLVSQGSN